MWQGTAQSVAKVPTFFFFVPGSGTFPKLKTKTSACPPATFFQRLQCHYVQIKAVNWFLILPWSPDGLWLPLLSSWWHICYPGHKLGGIFESFLFSTPTPYLCANPSGTLTKLRREDALFLPIHYGHSSPQKPIPSCLGNGTPLLVVFPLCLLIIFPPHYEQVILLKQGPTIILWCLSVSLPVVVVLFLLLW